MVQVGGPDPRTPLPQPAPRLFVYDLRGYRTTMMANERKESYFSNSSCRVHSLHHCAEEQTIKTTDFHRRSVIV